MIELFRDKLQQRFLEDEQFMAVLEDFIQYRKEVKTPLTKVAVSRLSNKLNPYSVEICTKALDRSIINGWRGVFPESEIEHRNPKDEPDNPLELLDMLHKRYSKFPMPGFSGQAKDPLHMFYVQIVQRAGKFIDGDMLDITGETFTMYANLVLDEELNPTIGIKSIMLDYLRWIEANTWITAKPKSLFDTEGTLFKRFIRYWSMAFNNRRDILTGKYLNG